MSIIFQPGEDFRLDFPTVDTAGADITLATVLIEFTRVGDGSAVFATFATADPEVTVAAGSVALDVPGATTAAYIPGLICVKITGETAGGDIDIDCAQFTIRGCC